MPADELPSPVEAVEAAVNEGKEKLTEAALDVAPDDEPPAKKRALVEMGGLRALDASIFLAINHLPHSPAADRIVGMVSDLGRGVGWVGVAAILAARNGRRGRVAGATAVAAMLCTTGMIQGPIKGYFTRKRPYREVEEDIIVGKETSDSSFPSGHTGGSFAAATALSVAYPNLILPAFAASVGVGMSRIYLGHHFPSDVLGGALIGAVIGGSVAEVSSRLERH
ncbi:MAG: phosphatase PAP2 family protein [Candidatus Dormibacteria bacterium]